MRLSEHCSSLDVDRAIKVTVDSFIGSQKVSAKKALARAFAKYTAGKFGQNSQADSRQAVRATAQGSYDATKSYTDVMIGGWIMKVRNGWLVGYGWE